MKPYWAIFALAVGLAIWMLACGQDVEPTRLPTSTPPGPAAAVVPAAPAAEAAQPATSYCKRYPANITNPYCNPSPTNSINR